MKNWFILLLLIILPATAWAQVLPPPPPVSVSIPTAKTDTVGQIQLLTLRVKVLTEALGTYNQIISMFAKQLNDAQKQHLMSGDQYNHLRVKLQQQARHDHMLDLRLQTLK